MPETTRGALVEELRYLHDQLDPRTSDGSPILIRREAGDAEDVRLAMRATLLAAAEALALRSDPAEAAGEMRERAAKVCTDVLASLRDKPHELIALEIEAEAWRRDAEMWEARAAALSSTLTQIAEATPEADDKEWRVGPWDDPAPYRTVDENGRIYEHRADTAQSENMEHFGYERGLHAAAVIARAAIRALPPQGGEP